MLGSGAGLGGREDAGKGKESKQIKAKEDAVVGQGWREGKMLEKGRRASRVRQRNMLGGSAGEREDAGKGEESKQIKAKEDAGGPGLRKGRFWKS
jgi:hypothetical protein